SSSVHILAPCMSTDPVHALSLHDALPICAASTSAGCVSTMLNVRSSITFIDSTSGINWRPILSCWAQRLMDATQSSALTGAPSRSEEHTSELQSRENLVCRLLLEKKNIEE